ncbi:MAG: Mur ligase family protein [Gammaproteobacteria bacterium]|nr:Mur ligase family protein [Gammaproteobacteria bacterium]MDH3448120.1 Mur ligase family protein [Gammaproteobacteria bacterium]
MEIPHPESRRLVLDGCRRLTGPSLVWNETGAILDVLVDDIDMEQVLGCWRRHVDAVVAAVQWPQPRLTHRRFENGYNLLLAAPVDQLYSALGLLETAWYFCACELLGVTAEPADGFIRAISDEMLAEKNDALVALQAAAADHGVDFLVDDETVFVGHGNGCRIFSIDQIPPAEQIDWASVHDIPVALITGTNGKSTSVRLLDAIARSAGQVSGITSTDFVRIGDEILDEGDYSGPGGARLLLRDPRLQVAFLEVARGGILRRGLALGRARAALVTNVASDHLGQYGVNSMEALAATKFVVREALTETGVLVVNADDACSVEHLAGKPRQALCWFSFDGSNPIIRQQLDDRGRCCFAEAGEIINFDGDRFTKICDIAAIPMTLNGAARHNVSNALGAVGIASAMGYGDDQIRAGLCHFYSDARDNPGRMNIFELENSVRVVVDFAHNAHGVAAVVDTVAHLPARRKWALFGSAGDRSDDEIAAIASGVCAIDPDCVVITELDKYLRGRAPGEVGEIMKRACLQQGLAQDRIHIAESPMAGVRYALERMQAEDLGLFLVLSQREQVIDYLESHLAKKAD